jgi:hypothetical protein
MGKAPRRELKYKPKMNGQQLLTSWSNIEAAFTKIQT